MRKVEMSWDRNSSESTIAFLHVDVQLSEGHRAGLPYENDDRPGSELLRTLYKIHGVQEAVVDRYKIRIERTKVVDWAPICAAVEKAIVAYCE